MIPRAYFLLSQPTMKINNMFVFADAHTKAYGAVVYYNRDEHICLAMSKIRVAPLKATSLPRLELMGAVTASRLAKFVHSAILHIEQVHFWQTARLCSTGYTRALVPNHLLTIVFVRSVKPFLELIGHSHHPLTIQLTWDYQQANLEHLTWLKLVTH